PYQSGYARRAFRANQLKHHQQRRDYWLGSLLNLTQKYEQPLDWYATWAAYLGYGSDTLSFVFAAAINEGDALGDAVFEILCDSARGEHEIGAMGRHVVRSLLVANRPEGWQLMENMLVAAQRQEGLRQSILETVDEAHPEAFTRMLRVIVEQNMVRFSATVRAADVWFGLNWDVEHKRHVQQSLEQLLALLENHEQRAEALQSDDPKQVYVGLWVLAFEEVEGAIAAAKPLLQDERVEIRFVAAYLLRQLGIEEVVSAITPSLKDDDLPIAIQAFRATQNLSAGPLKADWFETLETFLQRFTAKETTAEPLVWPWMGEKISQAEIVGQLIRVQGKRSVERLIPYLPLMEVWDKRKVAQKLIAQRPWTDVVKAAIFELVGDRSSYTREFVLSQLLTDKYVPEPTDAQAFETLLTRKAADLRRGLISLLLKQPDEATLSSAQRLLNASKAPQRLAGLELLDQLQQTERIDCRHLAENYVEKRPKRSASEQELLDRLLASEQSVATLEDALGLFDPSERTTPVCPQMPTNPMPLVSSSTLLIFDSLNALIVQHNTTPVEVFSYRSDRPTEELLGNLYSFPLPNANQSREENLQRFPLAEVWQSWWDTRDASLKDDDGLELLRAVMAQPVYGRGFNDFASNPYWMNAEVVIPIRLRSLTKKHAVPLEPNQSKHISSILEWLLYLHPPANLTEVLLNGAQFTLAKVNEVMNIPEISPFDWRTDNLMTWLSRAQQDHRRCYQKDSYQKESSRKDSNKDRTADTCAWSTSQINQLWQLLRWVDEPSNHSMLRYRFKQETYGTSFVLATAGDGGDGDGIVQRKRPELYAVLSAFEVGAASAADVYEHLLGDRMTNGRYDRFMDLQQLTRRKRDPQLNVHPELADIVKACRDRILSVELTRGDLPTAATAPALSLSAITGIPTLIRLLQNFGSEKFARGWLRDSQSKASVFSHLFRISFPAQSDTPADFAKQVKAAEIAEQRLIELAVYAPQWGRYVEHALNWKDLAEAVWWFHAHTKDNAWQVDQEIRDLWSAQIAELTPLSSQDLIDGAVDVAWFQRIYKQLKPARWQQLDNAAKYASGGGGHKRAQLFADSMTGKTKRAALIKRITEKRHQDAVRALGLLPLAGKPQSKKAQADLLERYQVIQEFLRTSKKFGSQRKASEKLAARIGLENLARTANFPDPQRLEWAMEREAIADLAKGPVTVAIDEVSVSLSLTEQGEPTITVLKKGNPLKNVPAKLKKNAEIKALQERKRDITRQASRIRKSLEQSMCRGDEFTGAELKELLSHPVLHPILSGLVFVDVASSTYGYPIKTGLQNHDGSVSKITAKASLRIAHPTDLAHSKEWHLWQQQCFAAEQVQPFKQIFRELYVLTPAEQQGQRKGQPQGSVRYGGHQVNPRQTLALLGQRGWVAHPEEGIRRTFHDENLLVWLDFEEGWYTPTEVEGLTLDKVYFTDRKTYKRLDLDAVPPRVFSEVMRDLDLVVSVAHQGGVDPEASASTVEMRASLLRETSRLLKLENIMLQEPYALIEGSLGSYTLHLGSATVHRQPGGALCIVPVHSQHRGRLFLPFADDDPRTAEVISKALLLAQDDKIKDPTILEQLL
ncbi:MAG: DUF5724 domain-containing protein, partial [Cyanobacteria bacterium J06598_3]